MRFLFSFTFFLCFSIGISQSTDKYWVQFEEKPGANSLVFHPEQFLSPAALERRMKQSIHIDKYDLPLDPEFIRELQSYPEIQVLRKSKWLNSVSVSVADTSVLSEIARLPFVRGIQPVKCMAIDPKLEFPAKSLGHTNYHHKHYGMAFRQIEMLSGHFLHALGYLGSGITVAVLDAGFTGTNEIDVFKHLYEENRLLATMDFVDGDTNVFHSSQHGTAVLSCMAANLPGKMVGTAPEAQYVLIRTEDISSESIVEEDNWVAGAEFADSIGADILNTSLGYTHFDDSTNNHSYADMDGNTTRISIAADIAASRGLLVITSAGNMGSQPWHYISAPADADSSIAVAAVDSFLIRAPFSSFGPSSDGDLKPNVSAMGYKAACVNASGVVRQANGTSFSAPIVSGMAACLWQAMPSKTNMEMKSLIESSGHQYSHPDFSLGYGVPNFYTAYLTGRMDVFSNSDEIISVFPTQFSDRLTVHYYSKSMGSWNLRMLNSLGQQVFANEIVVGAGEYVQTVFTDELVSLNAGIYYIQLIKDGVEIDAKKVMKVKL